MLWRLHSLLLLFLTVTSSPDVEAIVARLQARYHSARTLQASFLERYTENGRLVRVEAGTAYFRRPGKMRWDYQAPEENVFLVDGKTAWFYVPADHTATRVPAKESADWRTPLALLVGDMKISRVCARVEISSAEKPTNLESVVLSCEVRETEAQRSVTKGRSAGAAIEAPEEQVYFEVNERTGDLERILLRERGDVGIEFQFKDWLFNPPVPDSFFRFAVPRGVAIVSGELRSGERDANR
jgi:outer membrane lipoprotein carrier protein